MWERVQKVPFDLGVSAKSALIIIPVDGQQKAKAFLEVALGMHEE